MSSSILRKKNRALGEVDSKGYNELVQPESKTDNLENIISVRILRAKLRNTRGFQGESGETLLSCALVEFLHFAPEYSSIVGGPEPEYKLTVQYRVDVDSFLVEQLQDSSAIVELLAQIDPSEG